jgi:hypothetical protein
MLNLLEPKEIKVDGKTFYISKFSAIAGREVMVKYSLAIINNYQSNLEAMIKLFSHVAVKLHETGQYIILDTEALINNYAKSWETCIKIEKEVLAYNCSFFQDGSLLKLVESAAQKLPSWITKILTGFVPQSSQAEPQPLGN